jgi:DNA topoisomerase VI subunit B
LPTPLDPKFVVGDFGVGLSEEQVYSVYTTYFESTKTENNDVIGALGLGSKTPFSYTGSFSITARKDGVEAVFTASIGESGEPEVVKLYSRPWTGSNGVKITVDVSNHDIYCECYRKAYRKF